MPITPKFSEPGSFVRYRGSNILDDRDLDNKIRYLFLGERVLPLRYPYQFQSTDGAPVAAGVSTRQFNFRDLDPARGHVYEALLGVGLGARYQVWHPFDLRQLRWDEKIQDITEDYTAVLEYDDSPYEAPVFRVWIAPNKKFPGIVAQNNTDSLVQGGVSIRPRVIWVAAKWKVEQVTEPALLEALNAKAVWSQPITFGGLFPD